MIGNKKGDRAITRAVLTLVESLLLDEIVRNSYVDSKLDNEAFAQRINENFKGKFRFPLNGRHVSTACEARKIENNRAVQAKQDPTTAMARLGQLEEVVMAMHKRIEALEAIVKNCK
jgi:hypothetical protein